MTIKTHQTQRRAVANSNRLNTRGKIRNKPVTPKGEIQFSSDGVRLGEESSSRGKEFHSYIVQGKCEDLNVFIHAKYGVRECWWWW